LTFIYFLIISFLFKIFKKKIFFDIYFTAN
jgi:hypothetical protein